MSIQGKFSGGAKKAVSNWPGTGPRGALIIPAPSFIVHFHTNNVINDWGYRMKIVPYFPDINRHASMLSHGESVYSGGEHNARRKEVSGFHTSHKTHQPGISRRGNLESAIFDVNNVAVMMMMMMMMMMVMMMVMMVMMAMVMTVIVTIVIIICHYVYTFFIPCRCSHPPPSRYISSIDRSDIQHGRSGARA
jgi:hypothetical protein